MATNSCSKFPSLDNQQSFQNILLINFLSMQNHRLKYTRVKYPRLRDFHNVQETSAWIPLFLLISDAVNATPILDDKTSFDCSPDIRMKIPTLHFYVRRHNLWQLYKNMIKSAKQTEKPIIIQRHTFKLSCTYCNRIRKNLDSWAPFIMFEGTATAPVWICLIFLFTVVNFAVCTVSGSSVSSVYLVVLSAMISSGVYVGNGNFQKSTVLQIWMIGCLIFVTYYSGNLTSQVVQPAEEFRFRDIEQLHQNNYKMVMPSYTYVALKDYDVSNSSSKATNVIKRLLSTAKVAPANDIPEMLATTTHLAAWTIRPIMFRWMDQAHNYMELNGISRKRCYAAEDNFSSSIRYMVVSPPISGTLQKVMKAIMEMGFFELWYAEVVGFFLSLRVQDRSKIRRLMKIRGPEQQVQALKLVHGKVKNVFILWVTCLGIALTTFVLERYASIWYSAERFRRLVTCSTRRNHNWLSWASILSQNIYKLGLGRW